MSAEKKILQYLKGASVSYEEVKHKKVGTCSEQAKAAACKEAQIAKSLIFKTDKGQFLLVVGPGNKSVNKKLVEKLVKSGLALANPEVVKTIADCDPGAVHPFGQIMNLQTYLDPQLLKNKEICFSPGTHTKTIKVARVDFEELTQSILIVEEEKKKAASMGLSVKKSEDMSEWYTEVVKKAELADYTSVSGCIVYRPYSYAIWENIQGVLDEKLKKTGHKNAYFPLLIPENLLKRESEHVEGFTPEVAWVTHTGSSKLAERLAIRPTSETIMYDSYSKWIRSWRDLPLLLNQWCSVVRWEFKYPKPFLRGREFLWQEGHTVHATKEDACDEVTLILDMYADFVQDYLAVPVIKGLKTEKEKFAGALYTTAIESLMPDGKGLQMGTSHHLGTNFAEAFNISFVDKDEKRKLPHQTSWAVTTRLIGALLLTHGDDKGAIIPPKIAPVQAVIIPILFEKTKDLVLKTCEQLLSDLSGVATHFDDRDEYSAGWKYHEWELKGVPVRIEVGPRDVEKKQAVIVRRDTNEKVEVKLKDLKVEVKKTLQQIQENLFVKAKNFLDESIVDVKDMDELKRVIKDKKMARGVFCGLGDCEEEIKFATGGATARCIPLHEKPLKGLCVGCGKDSEKIIYFSKSY